MPDRPDFFDDMDGLPDDDLPWLSRRGRDARRHPMPCPPLGVLMAYVDETDTSLTWRRRQRIREHIRRCDICHGHVTRGFDEVFHGVHEILKDALDVNQTAVRARDSRFRHALHAQKIKLIVPPLGSRWLFERWLAIAATVAAVVTGLMLLRPTVAVIQAEELIERAIAYERNHAIGSRQRIRQSLHSGLFPRTGTRAISTPGTSKLDSSTSGIPRIVPFSSIRDVVDGSIAEMMPANTSERDAHLALARLFEKHHFDWRKPFCMPCYGAWRASLPRKRDTVTIAGDILALRTTTSDSDLREVTLFFRRDSYRLIAQTFTFEGLGRVELEELERRQSAPGARSASAAAAADQRASAVDVRAVPGTEAGSLAPIVTSRPPAARDIDRPAPRRHGLSRWLERTFPASASAARSTFVPDLERRMSSVRHHLIALQRVASRGSSAKPGAATEAVRLQQRQQAELEYQALRTHLLSLGDQLSVLVGASNRSFDYETPLPDDWQRRATTALPHAVRLEYRLQRLFARDDLPPEEARLNNPRSVRATFEALWESIYGRPRY